MQSKDGLTGNMHDCQHDWPDNVRIQHGEKGIVFSKNGNYSTSFFEAFPPTSVTDSYVRGEGSSVKEAENNAFEKYLKMINCEQHDYVRKGKGESGICKLCSSTKDEVFPPVESLTCSVCNKPSSNFYFLGISEEKVDENDIESFFRKSENYCYQHYKEVLNNEFNKAKILKEFTDLNEDQVSDVVRVLYKKVSLLSLGSIDLMEDYEINRKLKRFEKRLKKALNLATKHFIKKRAEEGFLDGKPEHLWNPLFTEDAVAFTILNGIIEKDDMGIAINLMQGGVEEDFYKQVSIEIRRNMLHIFDVETKEFKNMYKKL